MWLRGACLITLRRLKLKSWKDWMSGADCYWMRLVIVGCGCCCAVAVLMLCWCFAVAIAGAVLLLDKFSDCVMYVRLLMLCCRADMSTGEAFCVVYESASVVKRQKAVSFGQTILLAMLLSLVGQAWLPWKLNDDRTCGSGFHPDSCCADCWCWCETIVWVRWIVLPSNWCDVLECAVQRCPPIRHHLRSVESIIQFGWAEEMWCISTRWKRGWWAGCDAAVEACHLVFGVVQRLVLSCAVQWFVTIIWFEL